MEKALPEYVYVEDELYALKEKIRYVKVTDRIAKQVPISAPHFDMEEGILKRDLCHSC